jgi:hypothetical protein
MPRIEIWKSKLLWQVTSAEEKRRVIQALRDSLNVSGLNDRDEEEPYLISKDGTDLLIWTSTGRGTQEATRFLTTELHDYFELLSYMSATKKTDAKKIAQKPSQ